MNFKNTRLTRGQLFRVVAELSKPDAWNERFELVIEGGQVELRPVSGSSVQPAERVGVRT